MSERWRILALLFCIRTTMAVQYQAVAALSPLLMDRFGIGLADIGLLIGLYLSPGIVVALPGGAIGRRFGDKQVVAAGMALMLAGGLATALGTSWEAQVAGRVVSGIGGVVLNVLMTKMVADWFTGHELASAMGIFINSWPVGIAAALMVLPVLAETFGVAATMGLVAGLVATGLAALVIGYRPPGATRTTQVTATPLRGPALQGVLVAASIWGLYNAALTMIFAFGPAMLAGRGWSASAASSTTSIVLWLVSVSVPLGGVLADRLQRRDMVLAVGLLGFAVLMLAIPGTAQVVPMFVALGIVSGIAAGPIMSLPGEVLTQGNRAYGMGLFFTVFYVAIFVSPVVAGGLADTAGSAEVAFSFGASLLVVALLLFGLFRRLMGRSAEAATP